MELAINTFCPMMLLSAVGDLRFCQVVDPERTVMMCVSKKIMKSLF
ncbi:hypothetical protein HMPREF1145_1364 [Oribacterium parvum ACB8]|nr:hypothetical protein [Oribacterium parvum]EJF13938.1 hypothetical protein HMPREF1145_1364 [Oribacterium parvum ACB8]